MLFPISDQAPILRIRAPYVTRGIIVLCIAAFLYELGQGYEGAEILVADWGLVPARFFAGTAGRAPGLEGWLLLTPLTSMFLHAGPAHILGNMLYLWVFGDNIEDACGHLRFVLFYLVCGVVAGFADAAMDPYSAVPRIGASGAISGVLGAYFVLHPLARIRVLTVFLFTFRIPAIVLLGLWFLLQVSSGLVDDGSSGVAWWAHVAGFVCGFALILFLRSRDVGILPRRREEMTIGRPPSSAATLAGRTRRRGFRRDR